MKRIKMTLDKRSIQSAVNQLKAYRDGLPQKAGELTRRLTEQGVTLAQMNADFMQIYDTGALMRGIESRYDGVIGRVVSTAAHSIFCEFGTGVEGAGAPHPIAAALGWRYDVNGHGELGWWYYDAQGNSRWTKGMPSRPYMLETAKMLEKFVEPLAKEVFR